MVKLLRNILLPFVPIYYLATSIRNFLYDNKILKSKSYDLPVICVGNLSVGGTGKTPMIEYLVRLLSKDYKLATLSRGYKRKSKGFVLANENSSVSSLGDEPYQYYLKFGDNLQVAVDTNRQDGIQELLDRVEPEVILLDDAFQHRKVKAGFNILLTDYNKLYTDDFLLPTGDLREPKHGAKRADFIIVTKCPQELTNSEQTSIINKLNPNTKQKVFFSTVEYEENILGHNKQQDLSNLKSKHITIITGIANPKPLIDYLKSLGLNFEHLKFRDHHNFTASEIEEFSKKEFILTTEKDFVRLKDFRQIRDRLFYLPIRFEILNSEEFENTLLRFIKT